MSDILDTVAEAASLDPAIRSRVLALANLALDEAEYLIRYGDPSMKSSIIRTMMVAFAKHLRAEETNNEIERLKLEMQAIQAIMLGRTPGVNPDPESTPPEPQADRPPVLRRIQ